MTSDNPALDSLIAQIEDLGMRDILHLILEAANVIRDRGHTFALAIDCQSLTLYRRPASRVGTMTYLKKAPPLWVPDPRFAPKQTSLLTYTPPRK